MIVLSGCAGNEEGSIACEGGQAAAGNIVSEGTQAEAADSIASEGTQAEATSESIADESEHGDIEQTQEEEPIQEEHQTLQEADRTMEENQVQEEDQKSETVPEQDMATTTPEAVLTGIEERRIMAEASKDKPKADPVSKQNFFFDTICQVTIYNMPDMSEENADRLIQEVFSNCRKYENLLSKTVEGSDVWNINHAGGKKVKCDPETIELLVRSEMYGKLTDGLFDVTIGGVQDLWDFHKENRPVPPQPDDVKSAVAHVDYTEIEIDADEVRLKDPEAMIDLGGIAKGYIADRITRELTDAGVSSAIINLGGNIVCVGSKETAGGMSDFRIGIETPYSDRTQIVGAISLQNRTVVTSGVYERYFIYDGEEYHHILDPATGYPVSTDVLSVTIIADSGLSGDCDALATTCLLMGSEKGMALIEQLDDFEAIFITRDGTLLQTSGVTGFTEM